jgi:hypothetical protein
MGPARFGEEINKGTKKEKKSARKKKKEECSTKMTAEG